MVFTGSAAWLPGAIAPALGLPRPEPVNISPWRKLVGFGLAPLIASASLQQLSAQFEIQTLGGIQVSGAVALWLMIAGGTALAIQVMPKLPSLPRSASLIGGGLVFLGLWFAFGLAAQATWLPWLLVPARGILWPLFAIAAFLGFWRWASANRKLPWEGGCWGG
ncbi:MAG: hypothetical protein HC824_22150 [Synechococcales cyanobacterium RM1_1_8]|nr:hypothetical protein [Synechococcales cyanobacterium RM1_1_8]